MPSNKIQAIELAGFDSADLTANFQTIYPGGLPHSLSLLRIANKSNVDVVISYDGIQDNEYVSAGETFMLYAQSIQPPKNQVSQIAAGGLLSIKQATAAGVGDIFVSGYYNVE